MLEVVKVSYLLSAEYIYENDELVGIRHTDTGIVIPQDNEPYTEQELKDLLWLQEGGQEQQDSLAADMVGAMAKLTL